MSRARVRASARSLSRALTLSLSLSLSFGDLTRVLLPFSRLGWRRSLPRFDAPTADWGQHLWTVGLAFSHVRTRGWLVCMLSGVQVFRYGASCSCVPSVVGGESASPTAFARTVSRASCARRGGRLPWPRFCSSLYRHVRPHITAGVSPALLCLTVDRGVCGARRRRRRRPTGERWYHHRGGGATRAQDDRNGAIRGSVPRDDSRRRHGR